MTQMQTNGRFITFEGGDGAGKTKQIDLLKASWARDFSERALPEFTKEPGGGSDFSTAIRRLVLDHPAAGDADPGATFSLMVGSRFEHLGSFILPHVLGGRDVVSDRFEAATYAYQVVGQEAEYLRVLYHAHREAIRMRLPEGVKVQTIILDVTPEVAMERLALRATARGDENHFDRRDTAFHERVRQGLREYKETVDPTAIMIDGIGTPEEVHERIVAVMRSIFDR